MRVNLEAMYLGNYYGSVSMRLREANALLL